MARYKNESDGDVLVVVQRLLSTSKIFPSIQRGTEQFIDFYFRTTISRIFSFRFLFESTSGDTEEVFFTPSLKYPLNYSVEDGLGGVHNYISSYDEGDASFGHLVHYDFYVRLRSSMLSGNYSVMFLTQITALDFEGLSQDMFFISNATTLSGDFLSSAFILTLPNSKNYSVVQIQAGNFLKTNVFKEHNNVNFKLPVLLDKHDILNLCLSDNFSDCIVYKFENNSLTLESCKSSNNTIPQYVQCFRNQQINFPYPPYSATSSQIVIIKRQRAEKGYFQTLMILTQISEDLNQSITLTRPNLNEAASDWIMLSRSTRSTTISQTARSVSPSGKKNYYFILDNTWSNTLNYVNTGLGFNFKLTFIQFNNRSIQYEINSSDLSINEQSY